MAMKMINAAVLHGKQDIRTERKSISPPGPFELQIVVKSTGLCGSDVHYYQNGENAGFKLQEPLSLGHESSGCVSAIGEGLEKQGWRIGDKVAIECGFPCEQQDCLQCADGRYNICEKLRFMSSCKSIPHLQGTLQGVINHPAKWCHKLHQEANYDEAALLEPLSVAIHALRRSRIPPNGHCLIFGAGTVGLLIGAMCFLFGCKTVLICDIDQGRVAFALANGFATTGICTAGMTPDVRQLSGIIKEKGDMSLRGGFDRTFDCTGAEVCIQTSIYATVPGGVVILIGMGRPNINLPLGVAAFREVDIIGVFRYSRTYPYAIEILEKGLIPGLGKIITHKFDGLKMGASALNMASRMSDDMGNLVVKVILRSTDDDVQ